MFWDHCVLLLHIENDVIAVLTVVNSTITLVIYVLCQTRKLMEVLYYVLLLQSN